MNPMPRTGRTLGVRAGFGRAAFGLTDDEPAQVRMFEFGSGKITMVVYPGNPKQAEFLRYLVKEGHAFPDLTRPGR